MLRKSSQEVLALGEVRGDLVWLRWVFTALGLVLVLLAVFMSEDEAWVRSIHVVQGATMVAVGRGLGKAREWARHVGAACCALALVVWAVVKLVAGQPHERPTIDVQETIDVQQWINAIWLLCAAIYLWLPSTSERFRQARAAIARYEKEH